MQNEGRYRTHRAGIKLQPQHPKFVRTKIPDIVLLTGQRTSMVDRALAALCVSFSFRNTDVI